MSDDVVPAQKLPSEAMERLEHDLYVAVLRRLTRTVLIAVALVGVAVAGMGWLMWRSTRRILAEDAAQILQNDDALHSQLLGALDLDTAAISARLREALGQVDPRIVGGRGTMSDSDLTAMRGMIDQLLGDSAPKLRKGVGH